MKERPPAPYPNYDGTQRCRDLDAELFFPVTANELPSEARKACAACAFRSPCLQYALSHSLDGIWGGTTEAQRRQLRIQCRRIGESASSHAGYQ